MYYIDIQVYHIMGSKANSKKISVCYILFVMCFAKLWNEYATMKFFINILVCRKENIIIISPFGNYAIYLHFAYSCINWTCLEC